jgi:hypothetical protein
VGCEPACRQAGVRCERVLGSELVCEHIKTCVLREHEFPHNIFQNIYPFDISLSNSNWIRIPWPPYRRHEDARGALLPRRQLPSRLRRDALACHSPRLFVSAGRLPGGVYPDACRGYIPKMGVCLGWCVGVSSKYTVLLVGNP